MLQGYLTVSNDGHVPDVSPAVHQSTDLCEVNHVSCLMKFFSECHQTEIAGWKYCVVEKEGVIPRVLHLVTFRQEDMPWIAMDSQAVIE